MAKGIEARLKALETGQFHLYTQMARVKATLFGKKDEAPKKPRKPRTRKALGGTGFNEGAPGADDPRYADAPVNQKKRGRKKAEASAAAEGADGVVHVEFCEGKELVALGKAGVEVEAAEE